jgi:acetyl esterase/lipase
MRIEDYPDQEPLGEFALKYHEEALRRGASVRGIEAAYGSDPYQGVIVYPAEESTSDGTVLVFFHGGGWTNGYKEWMTFMAPALSAAGITFVTAGYRLAPEHVFPTGFDDALEAVAWVYRHIADHGGDPNRIFVGGHSAGGHYAALMALRTDWQGPLGLPADVITGVLPISATFYFTEGSGLSVRPRFLGPEGQGTEAAASPMEHARADAPPMLIAHGDEDFPHLMRQAEEFEAEMKALGAPVERVILPGRNHGSASFAAGEADGPWLNRAVTWMRRH